MPSVYRRRKNGKPVGPWLGTFKDENGRPRTITFGNRKGDAQASLDALAQNEKTKRAFVRQGLLTRQQVTTAEHRDKPISVAIAAYTDDLDRRGRTDGWVKIVTSRLNEAVAFAGVSIVGQIEQSGPTVQALLDDMADRGMSFWSVSQMRGAFAAWCKWLRRRRWIEHDPADMLRNPIDFRVAEAKRPRGTLTEKELHALVTCETVPAHRRLYYLFAAFTGRRATEQRKIEHRDIDRGKATLRIRKEVAKNKHEHTIPLASVIVEAMPLAIAEPNAKVFPTPPILRTLKRDLKTAGIKRPGIGHGSFRKFYTTLLKKSGVELGIIMQLRGDVGGKAARLVNVTYSDESQIIETMRDGLERAVALYAKKSNHKEERA